MRHLTKILILGAAGLMAADLAAQPTTVATTTSGTAAAAATSDSTTAKAPADGKDAAKGGEKAAGKESGSIASALGTLPVISMQHFRPVDQRGVNQFETTKEPGAEYKGFAFMIDAAFTQQFQGLGHENTAAPRVVNGVNQNQLMLVGHGFNNAVANLYVNAQLYRGIRVAMTSYLSARHHQETWVKDGYLQIDASPIDYRPLNTLMNYVTVKAGHFEINYGDAHFRRTDNGHALYNPLVGNYILDAFTTQVGGEVYMQGQGRLRGLFAMGGLTNGEVRGTTLNAAKRSPAYLAKLGFDRQLTDDLRVRLTASTFSQARSNNQTLFTGDRGGSRYYNVMENTAATETANFRSGAIDPQLNEMHAAVINPFIKYRGLEFFGNLERARGKQPTERARREFTQAVYEGTYRFLGDRLYVSGRHNRVTGTPLGFASEVTIDRAQVGGGWFVTPLIMLKGEWVNQDYNDFPTTDIRSGGRFKGFVVEGVVAF